MNYKTCYIYDAITSEYLYDSKAFLSPLEKDNYILPAYATYQKPPSVNDDEVAIYEDDNWVIKPDYRGEYEINLETLEIDTIKYIGDINSNYQMISEDLYMDYLKNPNKYAVINGYFQDITGTELYATERQQQFNKDFFKTSLGYIRRKVTMATGETKDFLSDLLPTISMGVQMGQPVTIITYKEPDFTQENIDWVALQEEKQVTSAFVQECFLQLSNDFKPVELTYPV